MQDERESSLPSSRLFNLPFLSPAPIMRQRIVLQLSDAEQGIITRPPTLPRPSPHTPRSQIAGIEQVVPPPPRPHSSRIAGSEQGITHPPHPRSQIAGTEQGITEPEATFSACFGAAFLAWHPMKYASMLSDKMREHGATAWLINTGYTGGAYGHPGASRISLRHTRAIVDAIHSGELAEAACSPSHVFGLQVCCAA